MPAYSFCLAARGLSIVSSGQCMSAIVRLARAAKAPMLARSSELSQSRVQPVCGRQAGVSLAATAAADCALLCAEVWSTGWKPDHLLGRDILTASGAAAMQDLASNWPAPALSLHRWHAALQARHTTVELS